MYPRHLKPMLLDSLSDTPVVLLVGARQTGKTTLVRELIAPLRAEYRTLDDAATLAAAVEDPESFVRRGTAHMVIDEVQRVPELLPAIKVSVDRDRRPGRFLLTGSANVLALPHISESLAGRMEILTLWPLSLGERFRGTDHFIERLFGKDALLVEAGVPADVDWVAEVVCGGFPEAVARRVERRRDAWFGAYVTTLLQREVRDLANISGLSEMPRLLSLLASRTAGLVNASELSRSSGIAQTTLKRYLALLEAAFLLQPLPAWSANIGKRLIKAPKIHLVDSGLAVHLAGLSATRLAAERRFLGPFLESYVVAELRKQLGWSGIPVRLYHFRSAAGREVDIVAERPSGEIVGIEVKASRRVGSKDFQGLKSLADTVSRRFTRGIVLYLGEMSVPFGDRLAALPMGSLVDQPHTHLQPGSSDSGFHNLAGGRLKWTPPA